MNALLAVLLTALPPAQDAAPDSTETSSPIEITVHSEGRFGHPDLSIRSHRAPARRLFQALAHETGRRLEVAEAILPTHLVRPITVDLKQRPLTEAVEWIAGAAGIRAEVQGDALALLNDPADTATEDELLRRALDEYRIALLDDRDGSREPELRFAIANLHYRLGEFADAQREYEELLATETEFPSRPVARLRLGHCLERGGDSEAAVQAWLSGAAEAESFSATPAFYLAASRVLMKTGETHDAMLLARHLIENPRMVLSGVHRLAVAQMLDKLGQPERSVELYQALADETDDPKLRTTALLELASAHLQAGFTTRVVDVIATALGEQPDDADEIPLQLLLLKAQRQLGQPGLAILAARRCQELDRFGPSGTKAALYEAEVFLECASPELALQALRTARQSPDEDVAARALLLQGRTLESVGQYQRAAESYVSIEDNFPTFRVPSLLGQARVALSQRSHDRCRRHLATLLTLELDETEQSEALELAESLSRHRSPTPPEQRS